MNDILANWWYDSEVATFAADGEGDGGDGDYGNLKTQLHYPNWCA